MRRLLLLVPAVCAANDTLLDGIDIAGHLGSPLTAGCSMIFLDLGANLGVQTRKLFEAEKYTKGKRPPVFRLFANAFGLDRDVWRTACSALTPIVYTVIVCAPFPWLLFCRRELDFAPRDFFLFRRLLTTRHIRE